MLTLHPEEQAWLDEYRKVLSERHPGTVLRMVIYGSMEDEANCLAGHLLIPNEAARKIVWPDTGLEAVCEEYGVSRRILDFRLNTSGARKRRSRWQQR